MFYNYNVKIQNKRYLHVLIATAVVLASSCFAVSQERLTGSVIAEQESAVIHNNADRDALRSLIVRYAQEEVQNIQLTMVIEDEIMVHTSAPTPKSTWMKVVDEVARWFGMNK